MQLALFVVGFFSAIVYGSFFEWALHRFLMHKRIPFFPYPFKAHALVHHRLFKADFTYHVQRPGDEADIPMAWWNGPALVAVASLPFAAASAWAGSVWLVGGAALAIAAYYGAYEYLHWCMHKPRDRRVERAGLFFRLNGHHLLHHRYMGKNFNVVLPLADLCLRTLLARSPVRFAQATGPSVPNVQPLHTTEDRHPPGRPLAHCPTAPTP
ncbi:MAG: sterol desaturase family protein [Verrucomicrobiae bacterium]|nr:sterol desaturase family protein [Verrucomicrobiae bacterium]